MYEIRKRSVFSKRSVYLLQAITFKSFFSLFSFPNLPHQFRQLAIFPGYIAVVLCLMWQLTIRAVLNSFVCHFKIPTAFISQCIQWAIAEQTVKVLRICAFMTRKIFTFFVAEKCIMFSFPIWFLHLFSPHHIKKSSHGTAELVIINTQLLEDLRYCSGVDNESVQICGGNECIRSSTACHLIIPLKGSGLWWQNHKHIGIIHTNRRIP